MGLGDFIVRDANQPKVVDGKKILIVDFSNLVFRTLYVAYTMDPLDTQFKKWKQLMTNSLYSLVKRFKPDQLVIALDQGHSWRKQIDPLYKAGRADNRDASAIDFEVFFPILNEYREGLEKAVGTVYFIGAEGWEADDIMGVLSKHLANNNEVITVTTDKDMYQLFKYKGYKQWNPITKKFIEPLNADIYLRCKFLTGDKVDGIPQVCPRMGIKTAQKWIDDLPKLFEEYPGSEERYILNKKLIDFEMIPHEIQSAILDKYRNYSFEPYSGRKVMDYLSRNDQVSVINYIQEFSDCFRNLKSLQQLED